MSIIKGIVKYAFLLALIGVGICVIGMGIMMFGGVTIFGYKYFRYSQTLEGEYIQVVYMDSTLADSIGLGLSGDKLDAYNANYIGDFDTIKIIAPDLDVNVVNGTYDVMTVFGKISANGVIDTRKIEGYDESKDLASQVFKYKKPYVENNTLYIVFDTVSGLVNYSNSTINISFPTHLRDVENVFVECRDFNASFSESAVHRVGSSQNVVNPFTVTNTLSVKTTSGNQTIKEMLLNNIDLETESGDVYVGNLKNVLMIDDEENSKKITDTILTLDVPSGVSKDKITTGVKGKLSIKNQRGNIKVQENCLVLGGCYVESDYSKITMGDLGTEWTSTGKTPTFAYKGYASYIKLNNVYGVVSIDSPNAVLNLNAIRKNESSLGELSVIGGESFALNIDEIIGSIVNVVTESGNVNIGKLDSNTTDITTKSGNVTVGKLYSSAKIITDGGNITVTEDKGDEYMTKYAESVLDAETKKGNVVFNDISSAVKLKTTDGAYSKVRFANILADSNFENGGSLEIALPFQRSVLITKGAGTADVWISNIQYEKKDDVACNYLNLTSDQVIVTGDNEDPALNTYTDNTDENKGKVLKKVVVTTTSGTVKIRDTAK